LYRALLRLEHRGETRKDKIQVNLAEVGIGSLIWVYLLQPNTTLFFQCISLALIVRVGHVYLLDTAATFHIIDNTVALITLPFLARAIGLLGSATRCNHNS
jgi:hypothetical protein